MTSWAASPLRSHTFPEASGTASMCQGTKDLQGHILDSSTHEENQAQPLLVWELLSILRNRRTKADQKGNKDASLCHHDDGGALVGTRSQHRKPPPCLTWTSLSPRPAP